MIRDTKEESPKISLHGKSEIPREFSLKDIKIAEFWAWLVDGYAIQLYVDKESIDPHKRAKKEERIVVVSKKEIKELIQKSIESKDSISTQELIRIAAEQKRISHETVRKSIRLGSGEYFKLLSIKLMENSSFAEVAEKILATAMKQKIDQIVADYSESSSTIKERSAHLINVINSWKDDRPKSRSMGKELNLRSEKIETHIPIFFVKDLINFKKYVLSEIRNHCNKLSWCPAEHGLIQYFTPEWESNFESHQFYENLVLNVTVSSENPDRVIFNMQFKVQTLMELNQEKELFDTYGEDCVKEFINHFIIEAGGSKNDRYNGLKYSDNKGYAIFSYIFNFPTYYGEIQSPDKIVINKEKSKESESPAFKNDLIEYNRLIQALEHDLGYQDSTDHGPFVSIYVERIRDETIQKFEPGSPQYQLVNELSNLMQIFQFNITFDDFTSAIIRNSLNVDSVITIYINADLLKFLPLILSNTDWVTLADNYRQMTATANGGLRID